MKALKEKYLKFGWKLVSIIFTCLILWTYQTLNYIVRSLLWLWGSSGFNPLIHLDLDVRSLQFNYLSEYLLYCMYVVSSVSLF